MKTSWWLLVGLAALALVGCRSGGEGDDVVSDDDAADDDAVDDDAADGDDNDNDESPGGILDELGPNDARIYRDAYGVPHVYGGSNRALFYAAGYAQAADHLEAMLRLYRTAAGRLAEIDGASQFPGDYVARLLRTRAFIEEGFDQMSAEAQEASEAFADGVNQWMNDNPAATPSWAEPITKFDPPMMAKYEVILRSVEQLRDDVLNAGLDLGAFEPLAGAQADGGGSNFWALRPEKTTTGAVMLQGDPHVPWYGTMPWTEMHLVSRDYDVSGAAVFGVPAVLIGHNQTIAWTLVNNSPDIADAYYLIMNPDNPAQYLYDGAWQDLAAVEDTIEIAGQSPQTVHYFYSLHGPVFHFANPALAAKLSTWEEVGALDQMLAMDRAGDLAMFQTALQMRQFARWGIGFGQADGTIYYVWNGRVFARPQGYDFTKPVSGATSATEWGTLVPFAELPQETNPTDGFLQNCNNAAWFVCPNTSIHEGDYPNYVVGDMGITGRAVRALDQLAASSDWSVDALQALSFDTYSEYAAAWRPVIDYCYEQQHNAVPDPDDLLPDAIALIDAWDLRADVERAGVVLMHSWIQSATLQWGVIDPRDPPDPTAWTAAEQQQAVLLLLVVAEAAKGLYGSLDVMWGDIHYLTLGEQEYPLAGSGPELDSLLQALGPVNDEGEMACDSGSSFLMLVELTDPPQAWTTRPVSQSLDPTSPHYRDVTELYAARLYKQAWFTDADLLANLDASEPNPVSLTVP
jgi:acyl-homoserine lactone acylase PvdQ